MPRIRSIVPLLALLLGAIACGGGGDGPTGPGGGGGGGGGENLLTARFNDVPWTATPSTIAPFGTTTAIPGSLSFYGATISGTTRQLALVLGRIPGPGTYPLGMNSGTGAGGVATILEGSQTWTTPLSGAAGAVTITTLTDTRVAGTFAFEATPMVAGSLSPVSVTQGRFDVPLNTSWTPVPADQIGSRTSATIAGGVWNAATVVGTGAGESTVTFNSSNTAYSLTLLVGPITGPSSGPLSTSVPVRRLYVQRVSDGAGWGGTPGDNGTITVESLSSTRITGTFSGTLAPSIITSGLPPLVIEDGSFDVRIAP